jgi:hypothetical protein
MTIDEISRRYSAQPFVAFVMHLADGRAVPVLRQEFLARDPQGRTVSVYQPDGTLTIVDVQRVTDLELKADNQG